MGSRCEVTAAIVEAEFARLQQMCAVARTGDRVALNLFLAAHRWNGAPADDWLSRWR